MEKRELKGLITDYRAGKINSEDLDRLYRFLETEEGADLLYEIWDDELHPSYYIGDELIKPRILQNIFEDERLSLEHHVRIASPKMRWYNFSIAASVLFLLGLIGAFWWYYQGLHMDRNLSLEESAAILPGSHKARIQFEDGSFVELDQIAGDTLIRDKGLHIFRKADGSISYAYDEGKAVHKELYNTIVTPRGGEYSLTLPDGSKVWLNAATTLRYPLEFGEDHRTVELDGEAYFEVVKQKRKDKRIPFYVATGRQKVEVLGTQFNVNTYGQEYKTTLIEGRVAMHYQNSSDVKVLAPSQQAVYSIATGTSRIVSVDPYYSVAWRSGKFAFDGASIYQVMEDVARWYDVEVEYNADMSQIKYSGSISRFENFEQLLQLIEWTDLVTFKVQGRRITVMK